jgi:SAM-dependent methyltransferase
MRLLPFTYPWIVRRDIEGSVLDVGCGDGAQMKMINFDNTLYVTGIDLYKPYVEKATKSGIYKKVLLGDIRKMKANSHSFDCVLSSQVVEHLTKKEAISLIDAMEKIAKKKVIIGTTNGFFPFDPLEGKDGNPLQVHKSGWSIKEFRELGYRVYGQGLGIVYKPDGLAHRYPGGNIIWFALSYLLSPITYYFPHISAYIIAVKQK